MFAKAYSTDKTVARFKGIKFPAKWFREHGKYTDDMMCDLVKEANCPTLVITGDKDVQANPKDVEKIAGFGQEHIKAVVVPNMDHILREFSGETTILNIMKQYKGEMDKSIHPALLNELSEWMNVEFLNSREDKEVVSV